MFVNAETRQACTSHDYRRAFGTRWAAKVKPVVLQSIMRHKSINTTLAHYVALEADDVAEELWRGQENGPDNTPTTLDPPEGVSPGEERGCRR